MAKDPAFLFYSKDWLEGTAEMLPAEKGIYIDLLSHQHQKKDLPKETERLARLVGLSHDEFLKLWAEVSKKFTEIDGRIINKKLTEITAERSEKGKRNTIIGTFASVLRKANLTKKEYSFAREKFKIEEFEHIDSERLTERLTEWLGECLKSIANGNANENEDVNTNTDETKEIETVKKAAKNLEQRTQEFAETIKPYTEQYGREMCLAFFSYWSEPNQKGKMRYELEKTWEVSRRLITWKNNQKNFKSTNNERQTREQERNAEAEAILRKYS